MKVDETIYVYFTRADIEEFIKQKLRSRGLVRDVSTSILIEESNPAKFITVKAKTVPKRTERGE